MNTILVTAQTVWMLMVVAPGGLTSLQSVYSTHSECEAQRQIKREQVPRTLDVQCVPIELN